MTLSELTASRTRLALVGLAKNTGKTEALTTLLRELEAQGRRVGVTSVGRDGEERDAIDAHIEKPRVRLPAGSLVASTDALLRASGLAHDVLEDAGVRTPLGRVLVACLTDDGMVEIAGPSAAADVRAVADTMLAHGAEQVLIDGAIDRRAASSPDVADGLLISTGAVLDRDLAEVVAQTRDAVALARLPALDDTSDAGRRLRALAANAADRSLLVVEAGDPAVLPPRFALSGEAEQVTRMLDENPTASALLVAGAVPERFLHGLLQPLKQRHRELTVVVADPTKVFLGNRGPEWFSRQGVHLQAVACVELDAITVNPVAPQSHTFDSAKFKGLLREAIDDVPIIDVRDPDYARDG